MPLYIMTVSNLYATLAEYKAYNAAHGVDPTASTADDAAISAILEQVSRYADKGRHFYPTYETRLYDIPQYPMPSKEIELDDDLLAVVSFANGDASPITASDYILQSVNVTPYWKIALRGASSVSWQTDANGNHEQVLPLTGWWGYREKYTQRAWVSVGTINEDLDTSETSITMFNGHEVAQGMIIKINNELMNVSEVNGANVIVNKRGDNGSAAATHLDGATVYRWMVQEEIKLAVLETAQGVNSMRNGQASSGAITITAAGAIIRPQEVPPLAQKVFDYYERKE